MTLLRFTDDTDIHLENLEEMNSINPEDISFAMDVDYGEDGTVTEMAIDVRELIHSMKLYTATEAYRYGWR